MSKSFDVPAILPYYAVDLLMEAKHVLTAATGSQPEFLPQCLKQLSDAIIVFEANMPLVDGVIQSTLPPCEGDLH